MTINKQRVLDEFYELIKIPCPSLGEREVADLLKKKLEELGGKVTEDMQAAKALNGTAGNLVADFKGTVAGAPRILLNAHMDCVNPCAGIKPHIEDGVIKSDGTTILGGDDKGGVVAILEALRCLKEQNLPHGDIQVVFSVSEEQGCAGAKNLDTSLLHSDIGYALDSSGRPGKIIFAAPGQNKIFAKVHGKTAHGGVAPEKGINAIKKAAEILMDVPTSRIDEETTCNIGIIHGGSATNAVDVSHISTYGFWDVLERSEKPIIATHSCAYTLCDHPRNLRDDQLKALVKTGGFVGINFAGQFLEKDWNDACIESVYRHLAYMMDVMGNDGHLGFGSDFDGISHPPYNLQGVQDFAPLFEYLGKKFSDTTIKKLAYQNCLSYLEKVL